MLACKCYCKWHSSLIRQIRLWLGITFPQIPKTLCTVCLHFQLVLLKTVLQYVCATGPVNLPLWFQHRVKTSMWRVHLFVLAVVAVCVSGGESSAVEETSTGQSQHCACTCCVQGAPSVSKWYFIIIWSCCVVGLSPKNTQPSCELASTEVTCIASWQDLFYIFQKEARRTPLFPTTRSLHPLLLFHIHRDARNVSHCYNSDKYCQLSELPDKCIIVAAYTHSILAVYPAALLVSFSLTIGFSSNVQHFQNNSMAEISWTLPKPFCSEQCCSSEILKDYVYYAVSELCTLYINM